MDIRQEDLPATLQAYELLDNKEIFLAEQVVNNQYDIQKFTARFAGKLIKAKAEIPANSDTTTYENRTTRKTATSANAVMVIVILILVALIIYGFSTGWIQQQLHLNV